jgi:hypothetical protein
LWRPPIPGDLPSSSLKDLEEHLLGCLSASTEGFLHARDAICLTGADPELILKAFRSAQRKGLVRLRGGPNNGYAIYPVHGNEGGDGWGRG